jgi:hypothetical protein
MIQKIRDQARDTGIKDPVAQPIIERLLDLGQSLKQSTPRRSPDEIEQILRQELDSARQSIYMNPLLNMDGMFVLERPIQLTLIYSG